MFYRKTDDQLQHDKIIEELTGIYRRKGFQVWTNPDQQRNRKFRGAYPDAVVKHKNKSSCWVFEISLSVNESKIKQQWKNYGRRSELIFVVPEGSEAGVQSILKKKQIQNAFFATYKFKPDKTITFYGLPGLNK